MVGDIKEDLKWETSKWKFFNSSSQSAKAFADDLSDFSSSPEDHLSLLLTIDDKCSDLDLTVKPEKCVSIVFNGNKMDHITTFFLRNGFTCIIADAPTKLLGRLIAVSTNKTKNAATSELENKIRMNAQLQNIKFGSGKTTLLLPSISN